MSKNRPILPRLIGVIHLPALAGAPGADGYSPSDTLQIAGALAVKEAKLLTQAGFDGLMIENFGDIPFYKDRVPPETVAALSVIAAAVRESVRVPIGINVLRNDAFAALAIASVTGCDFIRVNVLSGVSATDQGLIEGKAAELVRERLRLRSEVLIMGDAHVKHARSLSSEDLALAIEDTAHRGMADAVIVTGSTTGRPISNEALQTAAKAARNSRTPLYVGSGVTADLLSETLALADGVIVSSSLRKNGRAGNPIDLRRVRDFAKTFRKIRRR